MRIFYYYCYSEVPLTSVRVILSDPGMYVPVNCAVAGVTRTTGAVDVAVELATVEVVVLEAVVLVAVVLVPVTGAISSASAEITLADFEFATDIFVPYEAVMIYDVFPTETMPLNVPVVDAPGVVPVGATRNESSVRNS